MISRFSLWIPPPTHRLAAPSARQGRQPARKLCRCSSNSSGSKVLRTHWQFDNTICMLTMLGPSAWFCFPHVEFWASFTHQCFFWLVKWWNHPLELTGGPRCTKSHANRQDVVCILFCCCCKKTNKYYHSLTLSCHFEKRVFRVLEVP